MFIRWDWDKHWDVWENISKVVHHSIKSYFIQFSRSRWFGFKRPLQLQIQWTGSFFEMDICQKCNKPTNSKKILFLSSESAEQQKTVLWYFITFYFNEVTEQSDRLNASLELFSRKRRLKGLKRLQTKEGGSDGSLDWGCLKFHWKRCNVTVTGPHLRLACPYQQVLAKDVRSWSPRLFYCVFYWIESDSCF